jgi:Uma2 family endonuclease
MAMALPVPYFTIADLDEFPDDGNRYELLEGVLLVSPSPASDHQIVATRLATALSIALVPADLAHVVAVGAIQRGDRTQLQPDILVYPSTYAPGTAWAEIQGWWLAVEVMSPSSRIYDRKFKRAAYLALGVEQYWIVDPRDRSVEIWTRGDDVPSVARRSLAWRPAALAREITIDLAAIFRDVGPRDG